MLPSSFKQTNPSDSDETQAPVRESDSNNNSAIFDFLLLFSFLIAQLSRAGEHKRGHRYIPNSKSGVTLLVGTTTHMICLHLQPSTPKSLMFWRFQQLSVFILQYKTVTRVFAHSYIYDQILILTLLGLKVTTLHSHSSWPPYHIEKGLVNLQVC